MGSAVPSLRSTPHYPLPTTHSPFPLDSPYASARLAQNRTDLRADGRPGWRARRPWTEPKHGRELSTSIGNSPWRDGISRIDPR